MIDVKYGNIYLSVTIKNISKCIYILTDGRKQSINYERRIMIRQTSCLVEKKIGEIHATQQVISPMHSTLEPESAFSIDVLPYYRLSDAISPYSFSFFP